MIDNDLEDYSYASEQIKNDIDRRIMSAVIKMAEINGNHPYDKIFEIEIPSKVWEVTYPFTADDMVIVATNNLFGQDPAHNYTIFRKK